MSVVTDEVEYRVSSLLSTLDLITDRETNTYASGTLSYSLLNTNTTSILETRGTLSGSSHTFVKTTDYILTGNSIDWDTGGDKPDDATNISTDYVWTASPTSEAEYPCNRDNLPYIAVEVFDAVELPLNVGLYSSRGTDTVYPRVLCYVTIYLAKTTDRSATVDYEVKQYLKWYTDGIMTKLMKNKNLGDYIVDNRWVGMTGRRDQPELNAFFNQIRYEFKTIKEARF